MTRQGFIVGILGLCCCFAPSAVAFGQASVDQRVSALESRLGEVERQIGKLDIILDELQQLRNQDLPSLQRNVRGMSETAGRKDAATPTETDGGAFSPDDLNDAPSRPMVDFGQPAGGAKSIQQTATDIAKQLQKLDDVAEQLHALRNVDLPKIQRDIRGLVETSGRQPSVADDTGAPAGEPVAQGKVVIYNYTGVPHQVAINGVTHQVGAGRTSIDAPVGMLTTQLPQYDQPVQWDINHWKKVGEEYQFVLELRN